MHKLIFALITIVISFSLVTPPTVREGDNIAIEPVEAVEKVEVVKHTPKAIKAPVKAVEKPEVRSGNCSLVNQYNWPKDIAYGVCMAESGGNSNAVNWGDNHGQCSGSYGLMQVGCFWFPYFGYSINQANDSVINMSVAYKIWQRSGFTPWTTYTSGAYLNH